MHHKLPPLRLTGALCLRDGELQQRSVGIVDGRFQSGPHDEVDLSGYTLLPGIIDLHGDAFERHIAPRPSAPFSIRSGLRGVDRDAAANGVTTAWLAQSWSWEGGMRGADYAEQVMAELRDYQSEALTDLRLHSQWTPESGVTPEVLRREIATTTSVLAPIDEDAFLCSFGHIFAGGYAAGYYSYKWAEVLSADAFAAFEDVGLENEDQIRETGRRFRNTVLSLGGSLDPKQVFEAFRGRQPSSDALIRHSGLVSV